MIMDVRIGGGIMNLFLIDFVRKNGFLRIPCNGFH